MPISQIQLFPCTISAGTSLSSIVKLRQFELVGIQMPTIWTAASLTFRASLDDGVTFFELNDSGGTAVTWSGTANVISMQANYPAGIWRAAHTLQIRSGTVGVPVNQAVDAIINLLGWMPTY